MRNQEVYDDYITNIEIRERNPFSSAIESLIDPDFATQVWPEYVTENKVFREQMEERIKLSERLEVVQSHIRRPDTSLEDTIVLQHITEEQAADFYESLTHLLENNPEYSRIILYIPFEFLPNVDWKPNTERLKRQVELFRQTYLSLWQKLLFIHDVRANFVDGDVLETEMRDGDLPRVVKAAHLIPFLVKKGWIKPGDVISMIETSEDETLRQSIADSLPVLSDLGFLDEKVLSRMAESKDTLVRSMAKIISFQGSKVNEIEAKVINIATLQMDLDRKFAQIDADDLGRDTEKRKNWIRKVNKQKAIEAAGDEVCLSIQHGLLTDEAVHQLAIPEAHLPGQLALIDGIRKAIELIAKSDLDQARSLYNERFKDVLLDLWPIRNAAIQNYLRKLFFRIYNLNIADEETLVSLGISLPKLGGPFSDNLKLMHEEMSEIQTMALSIESHPELIQYVYPVVLTFGSRLKGYGTLDADIDVGVFVRPTVPAELRERVQTLLREIFVHDKIRGDVVEFWLEETENGLSVRNFETHDVSLGERSWTHILFGAAWEGNNNDIQELYDKLLSPYFFETKEQIYGRDARGLYIEEMERDTLQYRLMHKGYAQFFPSYGGIQSLHSDQIDGQSMFWDSGYRQLATKLFVERVFLPKLQVVD